MQLPHTMTARIPPQNQPSQDTRSPRNGVILGGVWRPLLIAFPRRSDSGCWCP